MTIFIDSGVRILNIMQLPAKKLMQNMFNKGRMIVYST